MAIFEEEQQKKPSRTHEVGQDITLLSAEELKHRVGLLKGEIARLEAEIAARGATKTAAEALFRR